MAKVFFITGASSGFGLELTLEALKRGHNAIGTVRSRQRAAEQVKAIEGQGGKVLELDVTHAEACFAVYKEAVKIYGHIDVLVNNAGMSHLGAAEDFTDEEVHAQMDINVYGPFRLIRAALPGFRERNKGTIVNVSSVAGLNGLPSCGVYAASKFALEGLSESLTRELESYDIDVLIVEPGAFRTNFLGAFKMNSRATLDHYPSAKATVEKFESFGGQQQGDPVKAAKIIVEAVTGTGTAGRLKGKVSRLPLGPDCVERFQTKVKNLTHDFDATKDIASSTDISE